MVLCCFMASIEEKTAAEERAAARRRSWTCGVSRSFAEAARDDVNFWRAATPRQRLAGLFELVEMMHDEAERRLPRSPSGTRKG